MTDWNAALDAAKEAVPFAAEQLDALKRRPPACLHPELTFDSGDYYVLCHTCNSRWVRVKIGGLESGTDREGRQVGGDSSAANIGQASGLSGHRRVEPK